MVGERDGRWALMAFHNLEDPRGGFVGAISDPMPVRWGSAGRQERKPRPVTSSRPALPQRTGIGSLIAPTNPPAASRLWKAISAHRPSRSPTIATTAAGWSVSATDGGR